MNIRFATLTPYGTCNQKPIDADRVFHSGHTGTASGTPSALRVPLRVCRQRGLSAEDATALVVNGFVKDVLQHLPMEFAVEAQKLISISLEGSVG